MRVFLTGATGLLGGALAGALLDGGHDVIALVRGDQRRILDMDCQDRAAAVQQVAGDVTLPGFGLKPDTLAADIAGEDIGAIDILLHCAATTDFVASDTAYQSINIDGARHAAQLAMAHDAALVHISTSYVCGQNTGTIAEQPADLLARFSNGYEASKARAEAEIWALRADGLRLAIARPSIILGRLADGMIARQDDFYNLFRLFGSPLMGPVPASADASFALVPIDHVVAGVMAMVSDFTAFDGRIAHLVADRPFAMADMLRIVGDYPNSDAAQIVDPNAFGDGLLNRRQKMVHAKIGPQFFSYFRRSPDFAADALRDVAGLSAPHIDEAAFRRMIDYCVAVGFLDWR